MPEWARLGGGPQGRDVQGAARHWVTWQRTSLEDKESSPGAGTTVGSGLPCLSTPSEPGPAPAALGETHRHRCSGSGRRQGFRPGLARAV